jgi:hypothetical protein
MKKTLYVIALHILLCGSAMAGTTSSIVSLSGGGDVAPSTSLNLSLSGLVPAVTYSVVCYIDTNHPFQYVLLGSSFTDVTSTIISYSLNGNIVVQDQLIAGHNTVVINGKFTNPTTANIIFTNLDQNDSFNVNNCFGIPIQVV